MREMTDTESNLAIPADLTNPSQSLGCDGLLELAEQEPSADNRPRPL